MAPPRAVLPDTTTLNTRRCTQRQLLLRPDAVTNEAVVYCMAVAAKKRGIEIHTVNTMSNHIQYVCTDPEGNRPDFERDFHSLVARCMNVVRGRWELSLIHI